MKNTTSGVYELIKKDNDDKDVKFSTHMLKRLSGKQPFSNSL